MLARILLNNNRATATQLFQRCNAKPSVTLCLPRHNSNTTGTESPKQVPSGRKGYLLSIISKENIIAKDGYNRWLSVPGSLAIGGSCGGFYAWSLFNSPLTKELGVVVSSASDWDLSSVMPIFSTTAAFMAITVPFIGTLIDKYGPRTIGLLSASLWGGGFFVSGIGVMCHQLSLLYLGYGALGGMGLAFGYLAPIACLVRWFPDKRGMAAVSVSGFAFGAILGAPLYETLLKRFSKVPEYFGELHTVGEKIVTIDGKLFLNDVSGETNKFVEVVVATANDVAMLPFSADAGVYAVGTGNSGVAMTLLTLSGISITMGALTIRIPKEGWTPEKVGIISTNLYQNTKYIKNIETKNTKNTKNTKQNEVENDVTLANSQRTPQFYLFLVGLYAQCMAGVGLLSAAKNIMTDMYVLFFFQF